MVTNKTQDVYGIQRKLPLNYIVRTVDGIFKDSLDREHHVVIFWSSKQGKTSLRKKNLVDDDYIIVHCSNKWDIYQLNINILKQAGFSILVSETKTILGKAKVKATFGFNMIAKTEAETEIEGEMSKTTEVKEFEIDPDDVNDVISALKKLKFNKYIVLEDFHYLKPEIQTDFSVELKAFHENSQITFIIIWVWLEENRLIALNWDLSGRVKSVNADEWTDKNLMDLIHAGEQLLNIKFDDSSKEKIINTSFNNVYIVQEVCYKICIENNIQETCTEQMTIDCKNLETILQDVISQHSWRYNSFLSSISDGFQATELEMFKWIMYAIIKSDIADLEKGIRRNEINTILNKNHPRKEELNPGNLTQSLKSIASLQVKKSITPIILDYDAGNLRLNVVDKGFLIWLKNQITQEILKDIWFE